MAKRRQAVASEENEIRRRLHQLLERHSQAEIARGIGVPPSYVNRWLNGTAIPAVFCRALVKEFDVNPAWLLTGEGAPYLSDVAERTGELSGDLLDVVKSLASVNHMRLGALAGKHHAKMLRELGDAMQRYDTLHRNLNRRSVPILREVLGDLRNAIDKVEEDQNFGKPDFSRAKELCATAEQLERLCDNPKLELELALLQGRLRRLTLDLRGALKFARKTIMLTLHHGGLLGEREFEALVEAMDALNTRARYMEMRRATKAIMALASDEALQSPSARWLEVLVAKTQVQTGELREGIDTLTRLRGEFTGNAAATVDALLSRALLIAGTIDVATAIKFGADSRAKALRILGVAGMAENEADLRRAIVYWDRMHKGERSILQRDYAQLVLRILQGETNEIAPAAEEIGERNTISRDLQMKTTGILAARLFTLIGRTTDAKRCFKESCRVIEKLPKWLYLPIVWQARHHRNALQSGTKEQQQQAREFLTHYIDLGYRCFVPLLND